jgi:putative isomerase
LRHPIYNNARSGGPSNWQGPVWGLSTFLPVYGLARYGFVADAREAAMRLIRTFALDIRQNGCLHEYYDGDTGQPVIKPGFLNWNMLAGVIMDDLRNGTDATTLDLLN